MASDLSAILMRPAAAADLQPSPFLSSLTDSELSHAAQAKTEELQRLQERVHALTLEMARVARELAGLELEQSRRRMRHAALVG